MSDEGEDLDGFLLGSQDSDATTNGQSRRHSASRSSWKQRPKYSGSNIRKMSLDDGEQRASGGGTSSGANDQDGERCRRRKKKESERRERRKMEREIELAFSSDSNEPLPSKHKPSRLKPPNSNSGENIKPDKKTSGSYEVGDDVEARFEGRLKWFSGKISCAHEGPGGDLLYDISYDDGDKEHRVLSGRVRRPGQNPPMLRAGLVVDVKLTRKGKGYHPGTIGRENDDGSLYVKFDDGDAEWSIPSQNVIPSYSYQATTPLPGRKDPEYCNSSKTPGASDKRSAQNKTQAGLDDGKNDPKLPLSKSATNCPFVLPVPLGEGDALVDRRRSAETSSGNPLDGPSERQASTITSAVPKKANSSQQATTDNLPSTSNVDDNIDDEEVVIKPNAPRVDEDDAVENGLNRILEGANSVLESTTRSPDLSPDDKQADGGGLSWIAEVANSVRDPAKKQSPRILGNGESSNVDRGVALYPSPTTTPVPGIAISTTTSIATKPVLRPRTSTHLEWKPNKDGSTTRRWGAPQSDDSEEEEVKPQESSSACPGSSAVPAPSISPTAIHEHATTVPNIPSARKDVALGVDSREESASAADALATLEVQSLECDRKFEAATIGGQLQPVAQQGYLVPQAQGQEAVEGSEPTKFATSKEHKDYSSNSASRERLPAAKKGKMGPLESPKLAAASNANDESGKTQQVLGKDKATSPGQEKELISKAVGQNDEEKAQRELVQSSIQRRYAAEAMHLSEEVRLLNAKLKAVDNNTRIKLAQQERKLGAQLQAALERERDKTNGILARERAASLRRIMALKEELKKAERQMDVELHRSAKRGGGGMQHFRARGAISPSTGYPTIERKPEWGKSSCTRRSRSCTSRTRVRTTGRSGHNSEEEFPGVAAASTWSTKEEDRDDSRVAYPSTTPWTRSERYLPAPPLRSPHSDYLIADDGPGFSKMIPDGAKVEPRVHPVGSTPLHGTAIPFACSGGCGSGGGGGDGGGIALGTLMKTLQEGLASRDESIHELSVRLHGLERKSAVVTTDYSLPPSGKCSRNSTIDDDGEHEGWGEGATPEKEAKLQLLLLPPPVSSTHHGQNSPYLNTISSSYEITGKVGGSGRKRGEKGATMSGRTGDIENETFLQEHPNPEQQQRAGKCQGGIHDRGREGVAAITGGRRESVGNSEKVLRCKLLTERRDTRKKLEAMKEEVERVVTQCRERAEKAEELAAFAEQRARAKALRYLGSKRSSPPTRHS